VIYIAGQILRGSEFEEGYLGIDRGKIVESGCGTPPERPVKEGIVVPSYVNCHTHVGDAAVSLDLSLSLEELVAPPDGLKHRALGKMTDEMLRSSMRIATGMMLDTGTSHFIDFREGGRNGAEALAGLSSPPHATIMGRPSALRYDEEEISSIIKTAHGIGISSISDWETTELDRLADHLHREGVPLALHASEGRREDIEKILSLEPAFIVHMCEAEDGDMRRVADEGVPTVVCPRSNLFMGRVPPLSRMVDAGLDLALGTDNFMNADGDMRAEMEMMARLLRSQGSDARLALEAAFISSRKLLNLDSELPFSEGRAANLAVYRGRGTEPACDLLFRSGNGAGMVCIR